MRTTICVVAPYLVLVSLATVQDLRGNTHIVWSPSVAFSSQYCLSTKEGAAGTHVDLLLWECDLTGHSGEQIFHLDELGNIRPNIKPDHCLAVYGKASERGLEVQIQRCPSNDGSIEPASVLSMSGYTGWVQGSLDMCLAIEGDHAFNGAKVVMAHCHEGHDDGSAGAQDWLQLSSVPGSQVAYASPNEDKSCAKPFAPVLSEAACVTAANVISRVRGCGYGDTLRRWATVVEHLHKQSWPAGCHFYAACQGGCSLGFNPNGTGASCPDQGDCMSIAVICKLDLRSSSTEKQEHIINV